MFNRHLIERIRTGNWGSFLAEIVIVMVGVFLGLQVDTWNDARKASIEERYYIERLLNELDESITRLDRSIADGHRIVSATRRAQQAIRANSVDIEKPEKFISDFLSITWMIEVDIVDGAIEELRTTGRLGVIGNTQIREALSRYYRTLESARSQEEISNQGWILAINDIYRRVDVVMETDQDVWVDASSLNGDLQVARGLFIASLYEASQLASLEKLRSETEVIRTLIMNVVH